VHLFKLDTPERKGAALALALVVAVGATVALWSPVRRSNGRLAGWRVTAHEGRDSCRVRMGEGRASASEPTPEPKDVAASEPQRGANSFAAFRKPVQATRASAPPTLILRTPSLASGTPSL